MQEKLLKDTFGAIVGENDLNEMINAAKILRLKNKTMLTNNECLGFVIVLNGAFKAFIVGENGREITIFRLIEGQACVICADCILGHLKHKICIESIEDSELLLVPSTIYSKMKNKYDALRDFSLSLLAQRFDSVIDVLEQSLFMPLIERIRLYLKQNAKDNKVIITHEALANHLGSAREAVSRILKSMQDNGEIKQNRKEIILL